MNTGTPRPYTSELGVCAFEEHAKMLNDNLARTNVAKNLFNFARGESGEMIHNASADDSPDSESFINSRGHDEILLVITPDDWNEATEHYHGAFVRGGHGTVLTSKNFAGTRQSGAITSREDSRHVEELFSKVGSQLTLDMRAIDTYLEAIKLLEKIAILPPRKKPASVGWMDKMLYQGAEQEYVKVFVGGSPLAAFHISYLNDVANLLPHLTEDFKMSNRNGSFRTEVGDNFARAILAYGKIFPQSIFSEFRGANKPSLRLCRIWSVGHLVDSQFTPLSSLS